MSFAFETLCHAGEAFPITLQVGTLHILNAPTCRCDAIYSVFFGPPAE
jgi:hypothetical protein